MNTLLPLQPVSLESFDNNTFKLAVRFFWGFSRSLGTKNFLALAWKFLPELWLTLTGGIPKLVILAEEDSALSINGKKNGLKRDDFDKLAEYLNVPIKIRYEKFQNSLTVMEPIIKASEIAKEDQEQFIKIIKERLARLELA